MRGWGAAFAALVLLAVPARADREPVLKQVELPHSYYWRELYLPQLTAGPSSVAWLDGRTLIFSMGGSLWRQTIGSDKADEITHPRGAYDYQPDVAPDGKSVVFVRYDGTAMELWRLDFASGQEQQLTTGGAVNVEPRISPDARRIAFVSTQGTGHFNLFVADIGANGIAHAHYAVPPHESDIGRYYYSPWDMAINPSWSPDGRRIYYVGNAGVVWGTGDIWSVSATDPADRRKILSEETSWNVRPEASPDGHRIVFSSYRGRQWRQLWLTTPDGAAPLPLSFGDYDVGGARWSPDGTRLAAIANEAGATDLVVLDAAGGARTVVSSHWRRYALPQAHLVLDIRDERGRPVPARVSVTAGDGRAAAPVTAWMHADDGFDRAVQSAETHYFHCSSPCAFDVPKGAAHIWVQHGFRYLPWRQTVGVTGNRTLTVGLQRHDLPPLFGRFVGADLHVHMNYGGTYRNTPAHLAFQARAEDLNVVYNLIVNKEERVPDIGYFRRSLDPAGGGASDPAGGNGALIVHSQEYHTSHWGHLGLLGLTDHVLTPGFAAYQSTALASQYPHNGVIADLAHAQGALVGYVHPFDPGVPLPSEGEANMLPVDVAHGKVDYVEIVGFSDHKITASIWYRLLNLGFHLPAGAGTDAMANYASLRGPVGMNRVFLDTRGALTPRAVLDALKAGRTFATNGPLLGLQLANAHPGDTIRRAGPGTVHYKVALRSFVPIEHLELVANGQVVKSFALAGDRRTFDGEGDIPLATSGWVVLRAWNDHADPLVLDIYPYATTSPVYLALPQPAPAAPADAAYFAAWIEQLIAGVKARSDFNSDAERAATLAYFNDALAFYRARAQ